MALTARSAGAPPAAGGIPTVAKRAAIAALGSIAALPVLSRAVRRIGAAAQAVQASRHAGPARSRTDLD